MNSRDLRFAESAPLSILYEWSKKPKFRFSTIENAAAKQTIRGNIWIKRIILKWQMYFSGIYSWYYSKCTLPHRSSRYRLSNTLDTTCNGNNCCPYQYLFFSADKIGDVFYKHVILLNLKNTNSHGVCWRYPNFASYVIRALQLHGFTFSHELGFYLEKCLTIFFMTCKMSCSCR